MKLRNITSTGHQSLPPMIIKGNQTADYIHWVSMVATSAKKCVDKIIYKPNSTSTQFKKR